ncbi:PspC domain-containing protein [Nonomuraea turcica]|uniref:PspC domain-containing protein n=1 Tax=Nonomuraea sp. G32 TaxID=3067274 RepID=UPI00273B62A8|nr:PspC domain-containing protein [Nonomuraea sp. G32]MDP4506477.1 PspC domain-containing protein [Nonomuraea sp. G32]
MTEAPPREPAAGPKVLRRSSEGRFLMGVCAGLGRYTGIDPVVFRVTFAVLLLGSGVGLFLYLAAFLLMKEPNGGPGIIEQWTRRDFDAEAVLALLTAVLAFGLAINLATIWFDTGTLVVGVLLAVSLLAAHSSGVDLLGLARSMPERLSRRRVEERAAPSYAGRQAAPPVRPTPTARPAPTFRPAPGPHRAGDRMPPAPEAPGVGAEHAETPSAGAETPRARAETPSGAQTHGARAETPSAETPGAGATAPGADADTPGAGAETPGAGAETPGAGAGTPGAGTGAQAATPGAEVATPIAETAAFATWKGGEQLDREPSAAGEAAHAQAAHEDAAHEDAAREDQAAHAQAARQDHGARKDQAAARMSRTAPLADETREREAAASARNYTPYGEPFAPSGPYQPLDPAKRAGGYSPYDPVLYGRPLPKKERRPKSFIGAITVLLAIIIGGIVVAVQARSAAGVSPTIVGGAMLITIGAGLLIAAWWGRGAGLVAAGTAVALIVSAGLMLGGLPRNIGSSEWAPTTLTELNAAYDVGVGDGRLDLSELKLAPGTTATVNAAVSLGELEVIVPPTVRLEVHASNKVGDITVDQSVRGGVDIRLDKVLEPEIEPKGEVSTIVLNLRGGLGDMEVRRAA